MDNMNNENERSKCCNAATYLKEKGEHVGMYCSKCSKWIKWVSKADAKAFRERLKSKTEYSIPSLAVKTSKLSPSVINKNSDFTEREAKINDVLERQKNLTDTGVFSVEEIKRLLAAIEKNIAAEDENFPVSEYDAIRKAAKTYELYRVQHSLENIVNGFPFDYEGE